MDFLGRDKCNRLCRIILQALERMRQALISFGVYGGQAVKFGDMNK